MNVKWLLQHNRVLNYQIDQKNNLDNNHKKKKE